MPDLLPTDLFYIKSFGDLSTCRPSPLADIPWDKIVKYAEFKGLDREITESFIVIIRLLDKTFIDWSSNEQKKQLKQSSKPSLVGKKPKW